MALCNKFPSDPYSILDPAVRWAPATSDSCELRRSLGLVQEVRKRVTLWRQQGYEGASQTSLALLRFWFKQPVASTPQEWGAEPAWRWYFCQQEAIESIVWLYEVHQARHLDDLLRLQGKPSLPSQPALVPWTRYVCKMATGSGKTNLLGLIITWSFFHRLYESGSSLATNFLLTAPNIIVLDRLRSDLEGLQLWKNAPLLPDDGYCGRAWRADFQVRCHIQDDVRLVHRVGNIFLTNVQRLYPVLKKGSGEGGGLGYYLGGDGRDAKDNALVQALQRIDSLVILNDEAHHLHDKKLSFVQTLHKIVEAIDPLGTGRISQFDVSATPRHQNGALFREVVSDYPLVEAIRQKVTKNPVLPNAKSRQNLQEARSENASERYRAHLQLGVQEWRRHASRLNKLGRKSILFIMTEDTKACDEVAEWLEREHHDFSGRVLTIHTKKDGAVDEESATGAKRTQLEELRKKARRVDQEDSEFRAIVSVMMLKEGWDVKNVTTIVGLRAFSSSAQILPEQALGRGLRKMFFGIDIAEHLSVVGTMDFMDFIESLKDEGVEIEYSGMGDDEPAPDDEMMICVDWADKSKDIALLDFCLPVLRPRHELNSDALQRMDLSRMPFTAMEIAGDIDAVTAMIDFESFDTGNVLYSVRLERLSGLNCQAVLQFMVQAVISELRLVGVFDVVYEKLEEFLSEHYFAKQVSLNDPSVLQTLARAEINLAVRQLLRKAVAQAVAKDSLEISKIDEVRMSEVEPFFVRSQGWFASKRCLFNKVVGTLGFERAFARWLERCSDVLAFAKNPERRFLALEYVNTAGAIAHYHPDFLVRAASNCLYIVELKGRKDSNDPAKWRRLVQYCQDASQSERTDIQPLFVEEDFFFAEKPVSFAQLADLCKVALTPETVP